MEIIISGKDKKLLQQVEALAKRLGLEIKRPVKKKNKSEKLYQLMEDMAASGGISSIKDPLNWQHEVREDKKLYGRE